MTILVTGATGLVGPRLLPRLVVAGQTCRALARPGREVPDGVERAEGDLDDIASLDRALDGVTAVVHLAALFRTQDEAAIWKVNVDGTKNLLDAAKRVAPDARFILASTNNVYAHDLDHPAREDDATTDVNAYAASKVAAENVVRESGLTWSVLRLPFIYGDGDGHIADIVPHMVRTGMHPAVRFSALHHEDIARGVGLALTGATDGRTVNIAGDSAISVYEMAQLVGDDLKLTSEPLGNPWRGQVDASLARELGFSPRVLTVQQAAREGIL